MERRAAKGGGDREEVIARGRQRGFDKRQVRQRVQEGNIRAKSYKGAREQDKEDKEFFEVQGGQGGAEEGRGNDVYSVIKLLYFYLTGDCMNYGKKDENNKAIKEWRVN